MSPKKKIYLVRNNLKTTHIPSGPATPNLKKYDIYADKQLKVIRAVVEQQTQDLSKMFNSKLQATPRDLESTRREFGAQLVAMEAQTRRRRGATARTS